ncbi:vgrG protein [Marinomonas sp. MED121]|uniref:type VI secretion system Vgr family protein n=1 Tax=Marinomonas sp. MED121 TaxID=314277 RepID=UPI000068FF91|nr:type VI secretion system tip protein VgrG [Marinomonas sp. MED121]EAQ66647.1 vgrG protein [Marinomonas sp. MED121]
MAQQTGLQFTLNVEGLAENAFVVTAFTGEESLSLPFNFNVSLASRVETITAQDVVDKNVCLSVYQDGVAQQVWHGVVKGFEQGDTGHHHTFYRLAMVPALSRLALRHNSRIFQLQTAPEIISILLQEMGIQDYAFSLGRECQQREYCVQYRESDLDFVARLAAEEGIFYFFTHLEGKHTLVFSDDTQTLPNVAKAMMYNTLSGGQAGLPFAQNFIRHTQVKPSSVQFKDYSFKQPDYSFLQDAMGTELDAQQINYEHFDYPGRYKDDESGKAFAQYRMQALRKDAIYAQGKSNFAALTTGYKVTLMDHPQENCNQAWLLVSIKHKGEQPQALEEMGGEGATKYHNQFDVIPAYRQWRANSDARPRVTGPQIAIVVGPEGEEVYCDEFGRVKVQFPWDRYSQGDEFSSAWVRVSQAWAGAQYGMVTLPRIGHEVIVSFLEGDPDQPIITGRTYHTANQAPYALPEHKTKTVLRTESHQGDGYNELRFEDQAEQEEVYLHAQKDLNLLVQNDRTDDIQNDHHIKVANSRFDHIKLDDSLTVEGERREHVVQNQTLVVEGSLTLKQGEALVNEAGNEIHLKSGSKVSIEASSAITIKAGGSFMQIDGGGVHLVGGAINLNAGGAAGKGSGYQGVAAELPNALENPEPLAEARRISLAGFLKAEEANVVAVKLCPLAEGGA